MRPVALIRGFFLIAYFSSAGRHVLDSRLGAVAASRRRTVWEKGPLFARPMRIRIGEFGAHVAYLVQKGDYLCDPMRYFAI